MATETIRSLRISNHDRGSAGLTYVYPVVSRRAGGISVGINFNPNNACNWRCLYCQVPELKRGPAPELDPERLEAELTGMLRQLSSGEFFRRFKVPEGLQTLQDIAVSGNGEPTTLKDFDQAISIIANILEGSAITGRIARVIISNGSMLRREKVQAGLALWGKTGGELWFKLDRATSEGLRRINGSSISPRQVMENLETAARLCPVRIQTSLFTLDGAPPSPEERQAYLDFLAEAGQKGIALKEVMLYGLARPSMQPEANRLGAVADDWMHHFAEQVQSLGLAVRLTP